MEAADYNLVHLAVKPGSCCVYVIGWRERGPCKIGMTFDLSDRLAALQTANPWRLRVFHAWRLWDEDSAYRYEQAILRSLRGVRLMGEWVNATPSQVLVVADTKRKELTLRCDYEPLLMPKPDTYAQAKLRRERAIDEFKQLTGRTIR